MVRILCKYIDYSMRAEKFVAISNIPREFCIVKHKNKMYLLNCILRVNEGDTLKMILEKLSSGNLLVFVGGQKSSSLSEHTALISQRIL
mgnify:CR=1 FL=1